MRKQKSIKKNFILNSLLTVTTVIIPLITFPYISRVLLVEANGKVDFAVSVINYFIMFSALGIPTYGIRICAKVREDIDKLSKTVHELMIINVTMTCVVYFIFIMSLFIVPKFSQEKELMLIVSLNLVLNGIGMNWLYSALEEYKYITIRSLIFKFISVICIFLFLHSPSDYKKYAIILVFSTVGSNILNLLYSKKFVKYKYIGNYDIVQHIKPILTFFATTVAISIYSNLDVVMVGFISGDTEVGYYTAGLKIRTALATLAVSLGTVLLPRLSYLAQNHKILEFKKMLAKSFDFIFIMAIPIVVYFVAFAHPVILFIAGDAYEGAVAPLRFLLLTVFFAGLSNVTGTQTMVPLNMENKLLKSIVCGALTDLILNSLLIPNYGSAGAACATAVTEIVVLGIQCTYIKNILREIRILNYLYRPIISSGISIMVVEMIICNVNLSLGVELVISSGIFGIIYGIVLIILKEPMVLEVLQNLKFIRERKKCK